MSASDSYPVRGIDVSQYQGTPDWGTVRASGISFAFARVADGMSIDRTFDRNWQEIRKAGLVRGVYLFFRSGRDPVDQADLLLDHTGPFDSNDLPPVLDVEANNGASPAEMVAGIRAFRDRITERTGGLTTMIYAGPGFWSSSVRSAVFADLPLWVAHYTTGAPLLPLGWMSWDFWQFSGSGRCPGVNGDVDLDVFRGSPDQLRAMTVGQQDAVSGGPASPGWSPAPRG